MDLSLAKRGRQDRFVIHALVFLVYLAAADAGHAIHGLTAPALIWTPAGIALAATLLAGYEILASIFLAGFVFYFFVSGDSSLVALGLATMMALRTFITTYVLRRLRFNTGFSRLSDAFALITVALIAAALLPLGGSLLLAASGTIPYGQLRSVFGNWYVGELLSLLVLAPFLLRWLPKPFFVRTQTEWSEIGVSLVLTGLITALIFWAPLGGVLGGVPLIYLLLMPLIWIGLRMGPRIMTAALLLVSLIALTGTMANAAPGTLGTALFGVELLLAILAVIFLLLVSLAEERKDITSAVRRQLYQLEGALEKIRSQDKAKNDFIAMLAHELRNPLAPLLSSLELLRLTKGGERDREMVNSMRGRVRTMARLLDDLLDVTRITHQKLVLQKEVVSLKTVVARAAESVEPEITLNRHTLIKKLPRKDIEIVGDPVRLEQVIVNLLNNAAKYTNAGGTIIISLARDDRHAVIKVADTGIGMVEALIKRVFDPFEQGEAAVRLRRGLGIGLALSKSLVEMHYGTIEARSEGADKGSEFIVRIPIAEGSVGISQLQSEREKQLKLIEPATKTLKVLVVDDNRGAADSLAALLKHVGHEARVAYDGASGLTAAALFKPQVIILDIGLPDTDGYEVAKKLRKQKMQATLIALTGYGQEEDKKMAEAAGFDYHVTKPVGLADLETILKQVTP